MLYICPTPIGNMGDITQRVLETLRLADVIAAEDTRRTGRLLAHFGIGKPQLSFFDHNEIKRIPEVLGLLREGKSVALVSDAGMPGISDPGYRLIKATLDEGLAVTVLPGPSSIDTALVASGFATDSFLFLGYLPRKQGEREQALRRVAAEPGTCVAFEAPHRLPATLKSAAGIIGDRRVAICRELTKRFEEVSRGTAAELAAGLPDKVKGEIVLVFEPASAEPDADDSGRALAIRELLDAGMPARQCADIVARLTGSSRNEAYRLAIRIKDSS
ncbi:MAG: 16S rRNA (cytidine(1402)-2'-O)-methyltransferase [Thermoleophilia bacterium]